MDIVNILDYFLKTNTPFMLLFVLLFLYFVKTSRERERRQEDMIDKRIAEIDKELDMMMLFWKKLIEKELEARKNES
jgi:BhlA-like holin